MASTIFSKISRLFGRKPRSKSLAELAAENPEFARAINDFLNDDRIPPEVAKSYVNQILNAHQVSRHVTGDPVLGASLTTMEPGACVYLMRRDDGAYKIGMSNNLVRRLGELQRIAANLVPVHYILCETREDAYEAEREIHKEYAKYRIDGEFFVRPQKELDLLKAIFWYKNGVFYYPLHEYTGP